MSEIQDEARIESPSPRQKQIDQSSKFDFSQYPTRIKQVQITAQKAGFDIDRVEFGEEKSEDYFWFLVLMLYTQGRKADVETEGLFISQLLSESKMDQRGEKKLQASKENRFKNIRLAFEGAKTLTKLKKEAALDPLTGLYRRPVIFKRIEEIQENIAENQKSNPMTGIVCFIDVDKFKTFNDRYGHVAGDKLLIEIARVLKKHFRVRTNDVVARYGGDEFMLVLSVPVDKYEALVLRIEKVFSEIGQEIKIEVDDKKMVGCGLSFGLAQIVKKKNPTKIIDDADQAMYQNK